MTRHPRTGGLWLTDAGLETWLVFTKGVALRDFAAFELLLTAEGRGLLSDWFAPFFATARTAATGLVLETPTWRASADWGARMGYAANRLAAINAMSVGFARGLALSYPDVPTRVSGNVGPRGDGYVVGARMDARTARTYHAAQIDAFSAGGADLVTSMTIGTPEEAIGIAQAAAAADIPSVIGFTLETDGRLPCGVDLRDAIERTDAEADVAPLHYLVNCAHPDHFLPILDGNGDGAWRDRIGAIRANASRLSHAELDAAEALDDGDPEELASLYDALRARLPRLQTVGGCCGTDHRHVAAIARWLLP